MKIKITIFCILFYLIALSNIQVFGQTHTVTIRLGPNTGQDASFDDLNVQFDIFPDLVATAWTNQGRHVVNRTTFQFYYAIPNNATIIDARLSLFANPNPENENHFGLNRAYLRRIVSPWAANTVTWNTQPDYITTNQVLLSESTSPFQDYLNMNVTNIVRDMVNNPTTSYGFILMLGTEWYYRCINFASGDCIDATKRPLLQITYTTTTGITPVSGEIPSNFKIYQNYPNPFNPETNIKFDIPERSFTRIDVFDMLGRNIETLVNETIDAGSYNLNWNGGNFSSGEFFYRIVTNDFVETKRMTLLK